ncbi:hypothetical protein LTR17_002197 [Elasticomyces elasticus]|nr:hypothetical protein LTR17_002197 [Elasticomyces elasticus]
MENAGTADQQCPLLSIAPEIRNNIYELAFTSNAPEADFFKPAPPTKALLLSCKQIWQEAKGLHKSAYRAYYNSTTFVIEQGAITEPAYEMPCTDEDLSHMRHVELLTTGRGLMHISKGWQPQPGDFHKKLRLQRSTINGQWYERLPPPEPFVGSQTLVRGATLDEAVAHRYCIIMPDHPGGFVIHLCTPGPDSIAHDGRRTPVLTKGEVQRILGIELQG